MLKQRLSQRLPSLVVNIDYPSTGLVETLGHLGAHAVFFDFEQGPIDVERLDDLSRAARLTGTTSLVRVFSPEDWVLERLMLRGVDGVVVPRLETPDNARQIVDTVRYIFPRNFEEKVIVIQIETAAALDRLDEFLDIEGIDCLFLGPVDLSKSIGKLGDYKDPAVADLIKSALGKIRASGKSAGMLVKQEDMTHYISMGANFLYLHANDLLAVGMASFKSKLPTKE